MRGGGGAIDATRASGTRSFTSASSFCVGGLTTPAFPDDSFPFGAA